MTQRDYVLAYLMDRMAMVLEQHLSLVKGLRDRLEGVLHPSRETLDAALDSLRSVRSRIREDLENILGRVPNAAADDLRDLHALISFYIEVAYPGERSVLEAVAAYTDVASDLEDLEEVHGRAVSVRGAIEAAMRG